MSVDVSFNHDAQIEKHTKIIFTTRLVFLHRGYEDKTEETFNEDFKGLKWRRVPNKQQLDIS